MVYKSKTEEVRFADSNYTIEGENKDFKITILAKNMIVNHKKYDLRDDLLFCRDKSLTTFYFPDGKSFKKEGKWRIGNVQENLITVLQKKDMKNFYGLWDLKGKEILPPNYYQITILSNKWVLVSDTISPMKQTIIDIEKGKTVGVYDRVELLTCDNLRITNNGETFVLDEKLKKIQEKPSKSKSVYYVLSNSDLQNVQRGYTYETKRDWYEKFSDNEPCGTRNMVNVKLSGVRLLVDKYNKNPIPNRLIVTIVEGNKRLTGIVNFEGKVIVPCIYQNIGLHHNGLVEFTMPNDLDVGKSMKVGLMDANGVIILPAKYDAFHDVKNDTAIVKLHGLFSAICVRTQEVILASYEYIGFETYGFTIRKNQKQGIADRNGKIIVPLNYDRVVHVNNDLFEVERDKQKFYMDSNGNEFDRE